MTCASIRFAGVLRFQRIRTESDTVSCLLRCVEASWGSASGLGSGRCQPPGACHCVTEAGLSWEAERERPGMQLRWPLADNNLHKNGNGQIFSSLTFEHSRKYCKWAVLYRQLWVSPARFFLFISPSFSVLPSSSLSNLISSWMRALQGDCLC